MQNPSAILAIAAIIVDGIVALEAFVVTAERGSLSAAARQLGVAPSVVTRRIKELEARVGVPLFWRSTRRLALTDQGELYLPKAASILRDFREVVSGSLHASDALSGPVRVQAPSSVVEAYMGRLLARFALAHPGVAIALDVADRVVNPAEAGVDIAIGNLPAAFEGVFEEPLHAYPRLVCAAPAYLARRGEPAHPRDLAGHDCMALLHAGPSWTFATPEGPLSLRFQPRFSAATSQALRMAAEEGVGITVLPRRLVAEPMRAGRLRQILAAFPLREYWTTAWIPVRKLELRRVRALLDFIKAEVAASAPLADPSP